MKSRLFKFKSSWTRDPDSQAPGGDSESTRVRSAVSAGPNPSPKAAAPSPSYRSTTWPGSAPGRRACSCYVPARVGSAEPAPFNSNLNPDAQVPPAGPAGRAAPELRNSTRKGSGAAPRGPGPRSAATATATPPLPTPPPASTANITTSTWLWLPPPPPPPPPSPRRRRRCFRRRRRHHHHPTTIPPPPPPAQQPLPPLGRICGHPCVKRACSPSKKGVISE